MLATLSTFMAPFNHGGGPFDEIFEPFQALLDSIVGFVTDNLLYAVFLGLFAVAIIILVSREMEFRRFIRILGGIFLLAGAYRAATAIINFFS